MASGQFSDSASNHDNDRINILRQFGRYYSVVWTVRNMPSHIIVPCRLMQEASHFKSSTLSIVKRLSLFVICSFFWKSVPVFNRISTIAHGCCLDSNLPHDIIQKLQVYLACKGVRGTSHLNDSIPVHAQPRPPASHSRPCRAAQPWASHAPTRFAPPHPPATTALPCLALLSSFVKLQSFG